MPAGPFRVDTTGLRTDNLPLPPGRKERTPINPATSHVVARPVPSLPPRAAAPPPILPPRQNETPNEHTPPPPPSYGEAVKAQSAATLNQGAVNRLAQAGVSVPGFGIGNGGSSTPPQDSAGSQGHPGQLSELQQRFARMSARQADVSDSNAFPVGSANPAAVAMGKKKPPPPPVKKAGLHAAATEHDGGAPPPIPMSSKPRPG